MIWQLAQLNIARVRAPLEAPEMSGFADNLDAINALADGSPGFVWRWITPEGDTSEERVFGAGVLVNLSVWESLDALRAFAYSTRHADFLRRRREWFHPLGAANLALWWVPTGHRPSVDEAGERLAQLHASGAGPAVFTFRENFPPPG